MRLTFHGAARTVTGSKHLLEVNGSRILLDCGLFQGRRAESYDKNLNLPFDASAIDVLVLSHAHIDHSGNIPNLVKSGFKGDIVATSATLDLANTMLMDSGHIQERDAEFVNKRNRRKGLPDVMPLYTQADALASFSLFTSQAYGRPRQIAPGVHLTLIDAGHMLGSASVILDIEDQEAGRDVRVVFSGDIGRAGIPIIRDPQVPDGADILIMESTYGDRLHEAYPDAEKALERIVADTYRRGGTLIMPAFAVGRAQQIVLTLHRLVEKGDIPNLPVFLDSPLAVNVTSIFQLHPECFDEETRDFMLMPGNASLFAFEKMRMIHSVEESKQLNFLREPAIIISASGMLEFGRILHHLKARVEDDRHTVLITGWQAPHTLGRRLVEGQDTVRIFGEEYPRRIRVEVLNGFSGHADRDELLTWVQRLGRTPQRTFLVHGEEDAQDALAGRLRADFNMQVDAPMEGQSFEV
jgi:metallo-beta-lactamase family protein